jgi:hypothetical protein
LLQSHHEITKANHVTKGISGIHLSLSVRSITFRDFDPNWASDSASCFLELVEEKLNKQPHYILPIMSELMKAVRFAAQNQQRYEVEEKIYGNFQAALGRIESL